MKETLLTILLFVPMMVLSGSGFDDGVSAYEDGDYAKAVEDFEEVLDNGKVSAELYFNLGNAYFQHQEIGKAILNYERALRLDPGSEDILHNLEYARTKTRDKIEYKQRKSLGRVFQVFMTSLSPNAWSWLTIALWVLGFGGLIAFLFTQGTTKKICFYTGVSVLIIAILSTVFALNYKSYLNRSDQAIVMSNISTIRQAPADNSELVFELHEGTKVQIIDENDQWYRVNVNDELDGWLKKSDVEEI